MYRITFTILLFLSATSVFAQNLTSRLKTGLPSPAQQLDNEANHRILCRSVWNGNGAYLALWIAFGSGKGGDLGLTPEQVVQLGAGQFNQDRFQRNSDYIAATKKLEQAKPKNDPGLEKADERQKKAYLDASVSVASIKNEIVQQEIEKTLTKEQLRKVHDLELQIYDGLGYPNPGMYKGLGLSDDQQEKMKAVRQKLEPEFEKFLDGWTATVKERDKLVRGYLTSRFSGQETITDDEWTKAKTEAEKQANENESLRKMQTDNTEEGLKLAARLKFELTEQLTPEQRNEMNSLLANPPDFVQNLVKAIQKMRKDQRPDSDWMPGPDSWRPGQGVPEEMQKERKPERTFPQSDKK